MPELPEVETVRRGLSEILFVDNKPMVAKVQLLRANLRSPMPKVALQRLRDQELMAIQRRAKYLLFEFTTGTLLNHLGMTGSWRLAAKGEERKHDHFYLTLYDGRRLAYHDPRRFGLIDWLKRGDEKTDPRLSGLGPEPLSEEFSGEYFYERTRSKKTAIKTLIMDQKIVVGVGNIYASEALFRCGVRPRTASNKISHKNSKNLVAAIKKILAEAIAAGGSTISDFRQAGGSEGYFQTRFRVYQRTGEPCPRCRAKIKSAVIGGRNSFWCPRCQR